MDILTQIVVHKQEEVAQRKRLLPLEQLKQRIASVAPRPTRSMKAALASSPTAIIAEFKRRSPSKGWLHPDADVASVVPAYERACASACSILTDECFFGGKDEDLRRARLLVDLPLLRKDFVIDAYQLYEAKLLGADAVLLIAVILSPETCRHFAQLAHQLGLEVLLEIHSEEELRCLCPEVDMLGVNLSTCRANPSFSLGTSRQAHAATTGLGERHQPSRTAPRPAWTRFRRLPYRRDVHEDGGTGRNASPVYPRFRLYL